MPPEPPPWLPPGIPPPAEPPPAEPPPVLPLPAEPPELDEPPPEAPPPDELPPDELPPCAPPPDEPPPDELDEPLEPPLLEEELPDEPLEPALPPGGMDAEGVEGVVGILADGQPASSGKITAVTIRPLIAFPLMSNSPSQLLSASPSVLAQIPRSFSRFLPAHHPRTRA